jgi:hypothetical protein
MIGSHEKMINADDLNGKNIDNGAFTLFLRDRISCYFQENPVIENYTEPNL